MKIVYDRLAELPLGDAAQRRAADIGAVFAGEPGVEVRWEFHAERMPRELVLVAEDAHRRAEEPITVTELFDGNGTFHEKLRRMKDSLADNGHWRAGVRKLMGDVERWASEIPGAVVERFTVWRNEEHYGRYELPALVVRFGPRTLRIAPLSGRNLPPMWMDPLRRTGERENGCVQFAGPSDSVEVYLLHPSGLWVYQMRDVDFRADPALVDTLDAAALAGIVAEFFDE
jgi:hypothetical protein